MNWIMLAVYLAIFGIVAYAVWPLISTIFRGAGAVKDLAKEGVEAGEAVAREAGDSFFAWLTQAGFLSDFRVSDYTVSSLHKKLMQSVSSWPFTFDLPERDIETIVTLVERAEHNRRFRGVESHSLEVTGCSNANFMQLKSFLQMLPAEKVASARQALRARKALS